MNKIWKEGEFQARVAEVMKEELQEPERWFYLSFAAEKFNGAVIIQAHGITDATMKCNLLGINPGGEVFCIAFPPEIPVPGQQYRNRLLSKTDVQEIWPDAKSIREFGEEDERAN